MGSLVTSGYGYTHCARNIITASNRTPGGGGGAAAPDSRVRRANWATK